MTGCRFINELGLRQRFCRCKKFRHLSTRAKDSRARSAGRKVAGTVATSNTRPKLTVGKRRGCRGKEFRHCWGITADRAETRPRSPTRLQRSCANSDGNALWRAKSNAWSKTLAAGRRLLLRRAPRDRCAAAVHSPAVEGISPAACHHPAPCAVALGSPSVPGRW
jgi:hypothetical protein